MTGESHQQPHLDIQALESDGNQGSLDLKLETIPTPEVKEGEESKEARDREPTEPIQMMKPDPHAHTAAGTPVLHPHNTRFFDANEDGI